MEEGEGRCREMSLENPRVTAAYKNVDQDPTDREWGPETPRFHVPGRCPCCWFTDHTQQQVACLGELVPGPAVWSLCGGLD